MAKDNSNKQVESQPITKDGRFASVHNDPRFKLPNINKFKVKVDSRFSKKELEKLSAGSSGKKAKIDRYGRKIKEGEKRNLDKFYEHESEDEDEDEKEPENEVEDDKNDSETSSEDESENEDNDDVETAKKLLDRARGEVSGTSSSEEDSESSESDDSEDEVIFEEEESEIELEDTKPEEGDPTDSFAVVNMDWDNLRAVDLMATFLSFVPANGLIKSVAIYPSEFGKEQMQKEEVEGPPRELFKKKSSKADDDDSDSDSDIDVNNADDLEKAARKLYTEDNGEEDYDSKALRRYQLQRLRYYYAVVKCDSVNTAKLIYDNCDGTEFESTANIFDLRYIPEDMEFDESEAKDTCTKIPASYKPESNFVTDALQHSKVKLTWDETPKERQNLASRQFSQKEIDEMDFKAYLASDTEESEEEGNDEAKNKYKNLLGGLGFGKDVNQGSEEEDVDMEITFNPGLDEKSPEADQKSEEDESTIAAYKRKEKERRKRRMEKFKKEQEDQKAAEPEQTDSKTKNKHKNKNSKNNSQDEKSKAELELIMMDEENKDQKEHFSMRDIVKAEKQKNRKKNKKNAKIDTEMTQDNFKPDLNDPRFNEIFENHDYAIDPTSSEFKKTETMKQIMSERSKRHRHTKSGVESNKKQKKSNSTSSNAEISTMVDKLKRKSKNKRR